MKVKLTHAQLALFERILVEQGWYYSQQTESWHKRGQRINLYFPSDRDYRFTIHSYTAKHWL